MARTPHNNRTTDLLMYGEIGREVTSGAFVAELNYLSNEYGTIQLRINSIGGSVFEGLAIFNSVRQCKSKVVAYVDGIAASMATIIMLACDEIKVSRVSMVMTHKPKGGAVGKAEDMRAAVTMLENIETQAEQLYAEKTGLTIEKVRSTFMRDSDTWFTAQEAVNAGLAVAIYDLPTMLAPPPPTMKAEQELLSYYSKNFKRQSHMLLQVQLSAEAVAALGLTATNAEASAVNTAIAQMAAQAAKATALETKVVELTNELNTLKTDTATQKADLLVQAAVDAQKITADAKDNWKRLAVADYEGAKAALDAMQPYKSIQSQLQPSDDAEKIELAELKKLSGRELFMKGKFERLKQLDIPTFKLKYKEYYGKDFAA